MKFYSSLFLMAILALAMTTVAGFSQAAPAADAQESEETPYSEEEYNIYEAAKKEPDFAKRGDLLLEFIGKYPKSALMKHIEFEYTNMLKESAAAKNYEVLELLSEKWLKLHPGDTLALSFVSEAARNLKKFDRCAECQEEIYKTQPDPTLAKDIFHTYQAANNLAKQLEWAGKLFKMSQFDDDYGLRWDFVRKYMESNNIPKAAEYAQLTIKAADQVKDPDAQKQEHMSKVRRVCYQMIGMNHFENNKFDEAITALTKSVKYEKYPEGYYYIGKSLDNQAAATKSQEKADEAMLFYAKAEQQGGELAPKAKERIEQLYKAMHNDKTIGIEKVYRKAKEDPR